MIRSKEEIQQRSMYFLLRTSMTTTTATIAHATPFNYLLHSLLHAFYHTRHFAHMIIMINSSIHD